MILRLKRQHIDLLKAETKRTYPIEACALLFGRLSQNEALVKRVEVAPNTLQSSVRFEIDPETFVKALIRADKNGLDFIGLFHSHPAPTKPSSIDLKYMKLWGDALWLIFSSTSGSLAAHQMRNGKVSEITIRVE